MAAEQFARHLIEEGLAREHRARNISLDELFEPGQKHFDSSRMSEKELDSLVDAVAALSGVAERPRHPS